MNKELIARTLVELRLQKNVTQSVAAEKIGIKPSALANYESGLRIPRDEVKMKIASYYGKSVKTIFFADNTHS